MKGFGRAPLAKPLIEVFKAASHEMVESFTSGNNINSFAM
jgi:hypothetical protein